MLSLVWCGVSDQLREVLAGAHGMPPKPSMFGDWRRNVQHHLAHDPTNSIRRLHPSVVVVLSNSFLPSHVIMLYLEPAIMALVDLPCIDVPRPPDLPALAVLVWEVLGWEDCVKMLRDFQLKI